MAVDDQFAFLNYKPCKILKYELLVSPDSIDAGMELSLLKSECAQIMGALRPSLPTYSDGDFMYVTRDNTNEIWTMRAFKKFELVLGPTAGEVKDNSAMFMFVYGDRKRGSALGGLDWFGEWTWGRCGGMVWGYKGGWGGPGLHANGEAPKLCTQSHTLQKAHTQYTNLSHIIQSYHTHLVCACVCVYVW